MREGVSFVAWLSRELDGTESPEKANRSQHRQFAEELERARGILPRWQQRGLEKQLRRLGTYFWLHGQMRDLSTLLYAQIRHQVLEIGKRAAAARRLVSADDVFYLNFREIYRVFEVESQGVVESRRHYELMYRTFCAPNEMGRDFIPAPPDTPAHG